MSIVNKSASHGKIQDALKQLKTAATEKENELIEQVSGIYESVKEVPGKALEKAREAMSSVDGYAHQKPWVCIGGAAAGGFILGLLFHRK